MTWRKVADGMPDEGAWVFVYWPTMPIHMYPTVAFHDGEFGWEPVCNRDYGQIYPTHWYPMMPPPGQPMVSG